MVDKKITELDAGVGVSGIDVFPFVDIGSGVTKKVTFDNFETNLAISGALVTDIANLVTVSGAGVTVSGATVTNAATITTVSGAGVAVSGALVTEIARVTTVSGATVTNKNDIATVSGAGVVVSGALVTDIANLTAVSGALVVDIAEMVVVSGATVTNAADIVTVSGTGLAVSGALVTVSGAGATHAADASDPHGATLTQTNISSTGLISGTTLTSVVGDHGNASGAEVINVVYGTGSTPPTAADTTEGTLYVQYTA